MPHFLILFIAYAAVSICYRYCRLEPSSVYIARNIHGSGYIIFFNFFFFECGKFALWYIFLLIYNRIEHSVLVSSKQWEETIANFLHPVAKLTHILFSLLEKLQISLGYWAKAYNSLASLQVLPLLLILYLSCKMKKT